MRTVSALFTVALTSAALFAASGASPLVSLLTKRYSDVLLQHDNPSEDLQCPPLKFNVPIPVNVRSSWINLLNILIIVPRQGVSLSTAVSTFSVFICIHS